MSRLDVPVNNATCTRCGECVADCPALIRFHRIYKAGRPISIGCSNR